MIETGNSHKKSPTNALIQLPHPIHNSNIRLDPEDSISPQVHAKFQELHDKYADVFNTQISGYSGRSFEAKINIGSVEPT